MSLFKDLFKLRKSPVVQSVGIYTFANFFSKGVSFLLVFIYTNPKFINPSENGLLNLLSNSILFVMTFVSLGTLQSTSTDFFKLDKKEFKDFFTTGLVMPGIITVVATAILFLFRGYLQRTYDFPYYFAFIIPLIAIFTFCYEQLISLIRNKNQTGLFLKVSLSKTFLELGISVILVVFFAWRWKGRLAGITTTYIITTIFAFYYFYKSGYLFGSIKKKYLYAELVYAIPIIIMQTSVFVINSSDKFFLSSYTNDHNETVGIYGTACVFASVINVLCTAYIQYLFPKIYATLSAPTIDYNSLKRNFYYYLLVMTVGSAAILAFTPFLYHYCINHKYLPGLQYIFLLGLGNFLWGIIYYFYSFLLFYKQKRKILLLSVFTIIISLATNYFFISRWGAWGAAVATTVAYFIALIVTLIAVRKYLAQIFFNKPI